MDSDHLLATLEKFQRRQEIREAERNTQILASQTDHIADNAWLCWSKDTLRFFLHESPLWRESQRVKAENPALYKRIYSLIGFGRFNGYVRYPTLPMVAPGIRRGGILTYVPVHGGITYFQEWWDGSVTYGFDTAHAVSDEMPEIISDVDWMMAETESMARGIQIAARFEPYYLKAGDSNAKKARVIDRMGQFIPIDPFGNFGVMINLLTGEL